MTWCVPVPATTVSLTESPGLCPAMRAAAVLASATALSVDRRDHLAGLKAGCGGRRPGGDLRDPGTAGCVLEVDAEVGVGGLAACDQLPGDALDGRRRHGEADPDVAAGAAVGVDLAGDADHLALGVQERAAAVAVVDRGVGLDRVCDRVVVRRRDRAVERRHDPGRDAVGQAEGVADRDHGVADPEAGRVTERERVQIGGRRVDVDDGHVGGRVASDQRRLVGLAVVGLDGDRRRTGDDVGVGGDIAVAVDLEAGALRQLGLLRGPERGDALAGRVLAHLDLDDARDGAGVDVGHGLRRCGHGGRAGRALDDRARRRCG